MVFLKIGDIAKRAKVSIRCLHHYDKIGLLRPSGLSSSGHRIYIESDIQKLQQIISLKSIGLSLNEIALCLNLEPLNLKQTLSIHQEAVNNKIQELKKIDRTLEFLLKKIESDQNIEVKELLLFMSEVKKMNEMYTTDQLKKIQERYMKYPNEVKRVEAEWPILFKRFEDAMKEGLKPEDSEVQKLAEKAQHFIDLFTGGDKEIESNLDKFYHQQQESALQTWGVQKDVFEFASKARIIFNSQKKVGS